MMINKIVIDSNIWIYSKDKQSKFYDLAISTIEKYLNQAVITQKNISEFIAVSSKSNIDYKIIIEDVKDMTNKFDIIYPNNETQRIFLELTEKYKPRGNKIFDIEIISIMLTNGINKITTINKKDFENISEIVLL